MRGLMGRAVMVAGAVVVLLGPAVGVASAAGGPAAGTRLAAGSGAVSGSTWGMAEEVPGTAALNQGGFAQINSVSCAAPGKCSAGGGYTDSSGGGHAFVVSEVNGIWGIAEEVPGTAALNQGGGAVVTSVSCAAPGNCAAGGFYSDSSGHFQAFVVGEVNGAWGTAEQVPGTAALNQGDAEITSVSCAAPGNCSAGGFYSFSYPHGQAFVVSEVNGTWGTAEQVPGTAALNQGFAQTVSVSCAAPGNCSAGGSYNVLTSNGQAFVVSEVNGTWGTAEEVPGTAGGAGVNSVSCAAPGKCAAGGGYTDSSGGGQAFVVSEVNGAWGTAEQVPGTAALNQGGAAGTVSVWCAAPGKCAAGGIYSDSSGGGQAFVVSEVNGAWGTAEQVPGTAALNQGGFAETVSVSCAAPGNCAAGGIYVDSSGGGQAFVVSEVNGAWGTAEQVPGTAALNQGGFAYVTSVSCAAPGNCGAGGPYIDSSGSQQAFVVNASIQPPPPQSASGAAPATAAPAASRPARHTNAHWDRLRLALLPSPLALPFRLDTVLFNSVHATHLAEVFKRRGNPELAAAMSRVAAIRGR